MPYRYDWYNPEVFLSYKGITIYHCYKDDDYDDVLLYWYTTYGGCDSELTEKFQFDVRELPTWVDNADSLTDSIIDSIKRAIDQGLIAYPEGYGNTEEWTTGQ